jgi:hypothetical protein
VKDVGCCLAKYGIVKGCSIWAWVVFGLAALATAFAFGILGRH